MTGLLERLERALPGRVASDPATLAAHRRDTWVLSELRELEGRPGPDPLAVVEPESADEVCAVVRLCREARTPIVAFGGGSGVCGGVRGPEGAVVVATRRLAGLAELVPDDLFASFRAGTNGLAAEQRLRTEGLTLGHWPQSIELSTVGGWVATRASGQFSTAYGSIEDLVLDLEVVLPDGSLLRTPRTPRSAAGPDLRQLFLGSEGTLGIVTEVGLSLRALPESSRGQAFHFEGMQAGLAAMRALLRDGWRPPVARLYDARESRRHFRDYCPKDRAMLLLLHEGPEALVVAQLGAAATLCEKAGGAGDDAAVVGHWLERRNQVPGFREFLEQGIVVDTIELGCTWSRAVPLYEAATRALEGVPGVLSATAHASHSYRSGTCLYFSFGARPERREDLEATYLACWRAVMEAAARVGAGITHHHGVGRVRREALARELGPAGVAVLRAVKRALDPDGLMNPGNLLPEETGPR